MKTLKLSLIIIVLISTHFANAQVKKFGKVSYKEFIDEAYKDEDAVVLFKDRKTELVPIPNIGWRLVTKIHERIKLNTKNGFEYATKKIDYYNRLNKAEEKILIKANTYNLVGNEVVKTKLEKKDIFDNDVSENWSERVFTMPNISEGSIVEWQYEISSKYLFNMEDIIFQYDIPIKYFKAKIEIIEYLEFSYKVNNPLKFDIDFKNDSGLNMVLENVPALKDEPYTKNMELYRGKVSFEVLAIKFPNVEPEKYSKTWEDVTKSIYNDLRFGNQLKRTKYFKEDLENLLKDEKVGEKRILAVFNYVKNKVKWNEKYRVFTEDGVKKAYTNGVGNVAEINLILTAMLKEAGYKASPILTSTRNRVTPYYPTRQGFNYVIVGVELQDKVLLLDATEPYSYINILPFRILNGQGRIIRDYGSSTFIDLEPKTYNLDMKNVSYKIDSLGNVIGNMRSTYTNINALHNRKRYNFLSDEELIKRLEEKYDGIEIERSRTDNKERLDRPYSVSVKFKVNDPIEIIGNKMFFSPLLFLEEKENIFNAEERNFPIDFGVPTKKVLQFSITIPPNYKIEKLPKSEAVELDNQLASFSYIIEEKNNKITLKITSQVNRSIIHPDLYPSFKSLYGKRILKHSEKIVLTKK